MRQWWVQGEASGGFRVRQWWVQGEASGGVR